MTFRFARALVIAVAGVFSGLAIYAFFNETSKMYNFLGWANAAAYFFFYNWKNLTAVKETEDWHK
jgi:hypothetical protein